MKLIVDRLAHAVEYDIEQRLCQFAVPQYFVSRISKVRTSAPCPAIRAGSLQRWMWCELPRVRKRPGHWRTPTIDQRVVFGVRPAGYFHRFEVSRRGGCCARDVAGPEVVIGPDTGIAAFEKERKSPDDFVAGCQHVGNSIAQSRVREVFVEHGLDSVRRILFPREAVHCEHRSSQGAGEDTPAFLLVEFDVVTRAIERCAKRFGNR